MEKITLTIKDILQLEQELNGSVNADTKEVIYNGFIKQNLPIFLKYQLADLCGTLSAEKKVVDELRNDLIRKYGEAGENGIIMVNMMEEVKDEDGKVIGQKFNPKYLELDKEFSEFVLNTVKEIEYPEITEEDLKKIGDSKDDYKLIFKLVKKPS